MKIKKNIFKSNKSGFTLIEILVVIGIIAILAGIVLVAINPGRQFAQARDTQRTSDVTTILNAIGQYTADHKGTLPGNISQTPLPIVKNNGADICSDLIPTYISALPKDPGTAGGSITDCASTYNTNYTVVKDGNGRITLSVDAETPNAPDITITR